jgi:hypothetical protein
MLGEKKVLVAIDSTLKEPYISITRNGPIATWANILHKNVQIIIYYCWRPNILMVFLDYWIENLRWKSGRRSSYAVSYFLMWLMFPLRRYIPKSYPSNLLNQNIVHEVEVKFLEGRFLQRWKKLSIVEYFLRSSNCDFLLLVTPSCYINPDNLNAFIQTLPTKVPVYAGSLQQAHDGPFVSGGTLIMNKEAARVLIHNRSRIPTHLMDDVAFGVTMHRAGVKLSEFKFLNLKNIHEIKSTDLNDHFYIRVAEGGLKNRNDVANMKIVHEILNGLS